MTKAEEAQKILSAMTLVQPSANATVLQEGFDELTKRVAWLESRVDWLRENFT